jgi:AcrR family transcriptional regulator
VRGRAYRYRVESYRDEHGRARGRWTYLGPIESAAAVTAAAAPLTRTRLLDALERLLERVEYAQITATAVSEEAGLAHGTFYRYFRNKRDAIRAAALRFAERAERVRASFTEPLESRDIERARLRSWAETILRLPVEGPGVLRAWYALVSTDAELAESRRARRSLATDELAAYLGRLVARGFASIDDPRAMARALSALVEGTFRRIVDGLGLEDADVSGALDVIDRAVFS